MTLKEMREKLSIYSDEMEVVRADNCGGYEDIFNIRTDVVKDIFDTKKPARIAIVLE